jgi:hypothetical protein
MAVNLVFNTSHGQTDWPPPGETRTEDKKMTESQIKVLQAVKLAQQENNGNPVHQAQAKKHLGKLPHPNTLDALVKMGALVEHRSGIASPAHYSVA